MFMKVGVFFISKRSDLLSVQQEAAFRQNIKHEFPDNIFLIRNTVYTAHSAVHV